MPRYQPKVFWDQLRNYLERFSWLDPRTGVRVTGFNPPAEAKGVERVPCFVKYITLKGNYEQGRVVSLKLMPHRQRMIQFVESKQIRRICDILIVEVDGVRFIAQ